MATVTVNDQSLTAIAEAIREKLDVETTYRPSEMAAAIGSIETGTSLTSADEGKVVVEDAGSYVLAAQTSRDISQNGTYDTTTNDEVVVSVAGGGTSIANPLYLMKDTGLVCTLSGRTFTKLYDDPAFAAYFYMTSGYTNMILVSETQDGATFTTNYDQGTPLLPDATIQYGGKTYYISQLSRGMPSDLMSGGGFALKIGQHATAYEAAEELLGISMTTARLKEKTITSNGTYTASDDSADGYYNVTVNVSGGGGSQDDSFSLTQYIESNGTQFINTGYSVKDNTRIDVVANASTTQPRLGTILGTRSYNDDYSTSHSCVLAVTWDSDEGNFNWGGNINRLTSRDKGNKTKYHIEKTCYVLEINGVGVIANLNESSTVSATEQPLFVFTLGINGSDYGPITRCNMKLYRLRIYEGDSLVMELLPYEDNGEACLRDSVTSNLFKNDGTGSFVFGTD